MERPQKEGDMPMRCRHIRIGLLAMLVAMGTGACGRDVPAPTPTAAATQEAISRIGDITVRASAVQTATLPESVASRYGIARDDRTVMVLVAVRQGPEAQESSLPAHVTATATDLRGQRHEITMRELRSGDLLDYVGTVDVALPDTLRFDLTIVREGGASSTMQFTREFYPR